MLSTIDSADLATTTGGQRHMFPTLSEGAKACIDKQPNGSIIGDIANKCLPKPVGQLDLDAVRDYWAWLHPGGR